MKTPKLKNLQETRMIQVTDDWYPCYENDTIKLTIFLRATPTHKNSKTIDYSVVISAWGADDFGLSLSYFATGEESYYQYALYVYNTWKRYIYDRVPDRITAEWFYEHGFIYM